MRPRSVRARLTLWYTGLLSVTVLLLGGTAYGLLAYSLAHDVDAALQGVAHVLAQRPALGGSPPLPDEIDAIFRRFFGFFPWDRYVERRQPWSERELRGMPSQGGKLPLSAEALKRAAQGLPTFETVTGLAPYPVRVLTQPVFEARRVVSVIQVGMSLESTAVARRRFLVVMAGVLPLALLLAGGGGWLLARRALRPVDHMAEAARRISAEHLDERLQTTGGDDELDRLAHTLNDMLGRLDAAFQQVRQFSADASHELQTPLTILKGELEVALRTPRSPEEYQRVLTSALEECERLVRLVDGLLLLARADAGVLRMDRQPVALDRLVVAVVEDAQLLADPHAVHLCLGRIEPLTIQGDGEHLRRLLLNLIDNGIKYTPPGGRVTLALCRQEGWAVLQVADTGIGLAPEEQAHIFQRFYRATNTHLQREEGSGLGLCIAQSIAEAHGGRIHVESTPGYGSTFTVFLPLLA
ncbi:MAG TPA: ATP-binding protein [Alphaproteobacteria bacterium]|nr:ATP-binding protein [Alphaproteobacteria bacterium]